MNIDELVELVKYANDPSIPFNKKVEKVYKEGREMLGDSTFDFLMTADEETLYTYFLNTYVLGYVRDVDSSCGRNYTKCALVLKFRVLTEMWDTPDLKKVQDKWIWLYHIIWGITEDDWEKNKADVEAILAEYESNRFVSGE
jgi:hypothetical protein